MIPLVNDNSPNAINTSLIAVKRELQTLSTGANSNNNGSGVDVTTELTESINGLKIAVDGLTETLTPGEETSFSCASAADAEYKEIDIGTADFSNLKEIAVIMTNGNTYGETTTASPTHPKLRVKNGDSILYELAICDCKGHVAGKGFCKAGDIIIFKHVSGKALVTNSDIRESSTSATSGYTIYSDGRIKYHYEYFKASQSTNYNDKITIPQAIPFTGKYKISFWTYGAAIWFNGITTTTSPRYCAPQSTATGIVIDTFTEGETVFLQNLTGGAQTYNAIRVEYELL